MGVNAENLRIWTHLLRTTDLPQGTGMLHKIDPVDGPPGYCCLGIGCLAAGIPEQDGLFAGASDTAPSEFIEWLGLTPTRKITVQEWDLLIDWPGGLSVQRGIATDFLDDVTTRSATGLNDHAHLSFDQIADVIDYFGLKGVA